MMVDVFPRASVNRLNRFVGLIMIAFRPVGQLTDWGGTSVARCRKQNSPELGRGMEIPTFQRWPEKLSTVPSIALWVPLGASGDRANGFCSSIHPLWSMLYII